MQPSEYSFHTDPLQHQREDFLRVAEEPRWAHLHEQGTGKTKIVIDTAAYLWLTGKIDGVIVVCPGGVVTTWAEDELPKHLPPQVLQQSRIHRYQPAKAATVWHQRALRDTRAHDGLAWMVLSYDCFISRRAKDEVWKFLRRRRCLYVLDESSNIQTPSAKRTISIVASGRYAPYKRILDGTPVANGSPDIYSQIRFLDEDFWAHRNLATSAAFKAEFGHYEKRWGAGGEYDHLLEPRNLDKLQGWLKTISSRVLKADVLDLPPKVYSNRYFELTPEQTRLYTELREEFRTFIQGTEVLAPLVLPRLLRLQQITCGYLPSEDEKEPLHLLTPNPRLNLQVELAEELSEPAIIWARFRKDIDQIVDALGRRAVRYDGTCDDDERERSRLAFKGGEAQFFVANPAVGGTGLTLTEASTEFYYSNSFSLRKRLQSEDRAHRVGQTRSVSIIDLVAQGGGQDPMHTIDRHISRSLVRKLDIASQITGDDLKEWLT